MDPVARYEQEAAALDASIAQLQQEQAAQEQAYHAWLAAWRQQLAQAHVRREQVRGALEALTSAE
jgi:DNA/RNA-binding domain of Phe-tRNA-synthetase-like protein